MYIYKHLYGESKTVRVANIKRNTKSWPVKFKKESEYNAFEKLAAAKFFNIFFIAIMVLCDRGEERPVKWAEENKYTITFDDGSWFEIDTENERLNICAGDKFIVSNYNGNLTYAECCQTGKVFYDEPLENPNFEVYRYVQRKQQMAQLENVKNFTIAATKFCYARLKSKTVPLLTGDERPRLKEGEK